MSDEDAVFGAQLIAAVRSALEPHPAVRAAALVGSPAGGTATAASDWDFAVDVHDFEAVARALPGLVSPLAPLVQQWDPLGSEECYMLMLRGPVKVDLIFEQPHVDRPPWTVAAETLESIDGHFWDWILWIAAKHAAGRHELVRSELAKMSWYLLGPLGVSEVPGSVGRAVALYCEALDQAERSLGRSVERDLAKEVRGGLRRLGHAV